jgi:hypothetical protein
VRRPASTLLLLVVAAPGCELFGLGTIRCDGSDAFCPSGYTCNADGICVGGGWNPLLPPSPPPVQRTCEAERCGIMPDSPTTTCVDDGSHPLAACPDDGAPLFGQDGNYLIDPPGYREEGRSVRDRVTGLFWQLDIASTEHGWDEARAVCDGLADDGRTWRLPAVRELLSLLDYGKRPPESWLERNLLIDTAWTFPTPGIDTFWSLDQTNGLPWYVDLNLGEARIDLAASVSRRGAWCTSGPTLVAAEPSFADGAWNDASTGLHWLPATRDTFTWSAALQHCEAASAQGLDDWRLPSVKELETLWQRGADTGLLPRLRSELLIGSHVYWSSTPQLRGSGFGAWLVAYENYQMASSSQGNQAHVRCVRGP